MRIRPEYYCPSELSILEDEFLELEKKLEKILIVLYPVGSRVKVLTPSGWYSGDVESHVDANKGRITIRKHNGRLHSIEYARMRPVHI